MRSSSVKTLTAVVTIAFTLAATAPTAQAAAKPTRSTTSRTQQTRDFERDGIFHAIRKAIKRVFAISTQDVLNPPIPNSRD